MQQDLTTFKCEWTKHLHTDRNFVSRSRFSCNLPETEEARTATYSRKVFLRHVPSNINDEILTLAFNEYDIKRAVCSAKALLPYLEKYAYVILNDSKEVEKLIEKAPKEDEKYWHIPIVMPRKKNCICTNGSMGQRK